MSDTATFTIDTTPPEIALESPPDRVEYSRDVAFDVRVNDPAGATATCQLVPPPGVLHAPEGGLEEAAYAPMGSYEETLPPVSNTPEPPWVQCTGRVEYKGLVPGTWTFRVRAEDGLGNAWKLPYSYSWVVEPDPNAAHVVIIDPPPRVQRVGDVSCTFAVFGANGAECRLFQETVVEGEVVDRQLLSRFSECTSPFTLFSLSDNNYALQIVPKGQALA